MKQRPDRNLELDTRRAIRNSIATNNHENELRRDQELKQDNFKQNLAQALARAK
jgi:hypothetical protein